MAFKIGKLNIDITHDALPGIDLSLDPVILGAISYVSATLLTNDEQGYLMLELILKELTILKINEVKASMAATELNLKEMIISEANKLINPPNTDKHGM